MRMMMTLAVALWAGLGWSPTPAAGQDTAPNTLTTTEAENGWKLLFDGETTDGWQGTGSSSPIGWLVKDGQLICVSPDGDILTVETFDNFDLRLQWKVADGPGASVLEGLQASDQAVKPAGEWNVARLLVDGDRIEQWLNGEKIAEYMVDRSDTKQPMTDQPLTAPYFGRVRDGHIELNGISDGNMMRYRSIKVRVIEGHHAAPSGSGG